MSRITASTIGSLPQQSTGTFYAGQRVPPLGTSTSSLIPTTQQYQHGIGLQQEAICLQALGFQPVGFLTPEEGYGMNDMAIQTVDSGGSWDTRANGTAPMMEHSFTAPGRMI